MDTLAYAKKLIEAGVPQKQVEVQAEALSEALKGDVAANGDIKELEVKMVKWFSGVIIGIVISILLVVLKLIH